MSTNSDIITKLSNGKWARAYCHWDGYLSNNGRILFDHYSSQALAEKLVSTGDMSSLSKWCDKPNGHTYDTPVKGYTVYYGRDRGETGVDANIADTLDELLTDLNEFTYVWDGSAWFCYRKGKLEPLGELLDAVEKDEDE